MIEANPGLSIEQVLLELFARKATRTEYLEEVVRVLCGWIGCCCGGIRVLDEYGNIPYGAYRGFSREFWEAESHLSIHKDQCTCIRVISGRPEPQDLPVTTPGGSFHCDDLIGFRESLSEAERARFRGTCVQSAYASLAVIPIRYRERILGALHLADPEEGKVSRSKVERIESMTPLIGEAIHRFSLEEEIQRERETLRVVNSLMGLSLEEISLEELLRQGLDLILSTPWLAPDPRGAVFYGEGRDGSFPRRAQVGLPEEVLRSAERLAPGRCVCGREARELEVHGGAGSPPGQKDPGWGRHFSIPLVFSEKALGLVVLPLPEPFRADERKSGFLESVCRALVNTLRHKGAEDAVRESERKLRALSFQLLNAQERERKRIARELHDGIGQVFAAIKFGVENTLAQMGERGDPQAVSTLGSTVKLIQAAVEEIRRISSDLRPAMLDDLGILATLGWFLREFETIYSGVRVEKWIDVKEKEVPEPLKIVIYRVVQEALNNVARHSRADRVFVSLRKAGSWIELAVEDKGAGFDPERIKAGLGLASMRERVDLSGGNFSVESAKGKGTVIWAVWPV